MKCKMIHSFEKGSANCGVKIFAVENQLTHYCQVVVKKILIQIYNGCEFVRPILDNTVVETFTALTLHYNYF